LIGVRLHPLSPTADYPPRLLGAWSLGGSGNRTVANSAAWTIDRFYGGVVAHSGATSDFQEPRHVPFGAAALMRISRSCRATHPAFCPGDMAGRGALHACACGAGRPGAHLHRPFVHRVLRANAEHVTKHVACPGLLDCMTVPNCLPPQLMSYCSVDRVRRITFRIDRRQGARVGVHQVRATPSSRGGGTWPNRRCRE
jgi:hypothetical protein